MGDAHRRVGHVDVLTTGTRGPVGVDPQVLLVDLDIGHILEERGDLECGEGGLSLALGVERRHAHQSVHTMLGSEASVGVAAVDEEGGRRDTRLVAGRHLIQFHLEPALLGPAQEHAQDHVGPVLCVSPALAGLDLADGAVVVVLAGEQRPQFEFAEIGVERGEGFADLGLEGVVALLAGEIMECLDIVHT